MKQCKVCGTSVHIDSNTCPSCGNHSFFVLDVKICPLCGKVNAITNSFCEQCGKPFKIAQGRAFVKKTAVPLKRPAQNNYNNIVKTAEKVEKPSTAAVSVKEDNFKDYIELKPEIKHGDDHTEVAYYVEGNADKLPVVMLPKFTKISGKNIVVNIIVNPKGNDKIVSEIKQSETNKVMDEAIFGTEAVKDEEYIDFSSVGTDKEELKSISLDEPFIDYTEVKETTPSVKETQPVVITPPVKAKKVRKNKITTGKTFASILLMLIAFAGVASFYFDYFKTQILVSGASPVLYTLSEVFKFSPNLSFIKSNNYAAFLADFTRGIHKDYVTYVHFAFSGAFVLLFINAIMTIINLRHAKAVKIITSIFSFITILAYVAIVLAMIFVFNINIVSYHGIGLLVGACSSLLFFVLNLTLIKPYSKKRLEKKAKKAEKKAKNKNVKKSKNDDLVSL